MNRRILTKDVNCFLKQPLAENILPRSQLIKRNRKKRFLKRKDQNKSYETYSRLNASRLSQLDKMREAELQIINEFWNKNKTSRTQANTSLLLSIEQIRDILAPKRIERQIRSELKSKILESRKIRFLYGDLSNKQLKRNIQRGQQLPGNAGDNLLILLESRLDVVLERSGFFPTVRAARQSIIHKKVYVNSRAVNRPGCQLQPGDIVQVKHVKVISEKNVGVQKMPSLQLKTHPLKAKNKSIHTSSVREVVSTCKEEEIAVFAANESFYNTYFHWLEVKKRLLSLPKQVWLARKSNGSERREKEVRTHLKQDLLSDRKVLSQVKLASKNNAGDRIRVEVEKTRTFSNHTGSNLLKVQVEGQHLLSKDREDQRCFQERRSKPLHLELSYQSYTAVFLYVPQRVYLPALVDIDLLVKT